MSGFKWTVEEERIIREHYPVISEAELTNLLPNRSLDAIKSKRMALGISPNVLTGQHIRLDKLSDEILAKNRRQSWIKCRSKRTNKDPRLVMFESARWRARKLGVPFNIDVEDIIVPERCPIMDIPLVRGRGKSGKSSPSLDRIIPEKGYIKGNVWVISLRANLLKSNATLDQLKALVRELEKITNV